MLHEAWGGYMMLEEAGEATGARRRHNALLSSLLWNINVQFCFVLTWNDVLDVTDRFYGSNVAFLIDFREVDLDAHNICH